MMKPKLAMVPYQPRRSVKALFPEGGADDEVEDDADGHRQMRGLVLLVDVAHRLVNELVAAEGEQDPREAVDGGQGAGEAAHHGPDIDQDGQDRVLAGHDVRQGASARAQLGRIVVEALHDQVGGHDKDRARQNGRQDHGAGNDRLGIAGFLAQGGGAFKAHKGEDAEHDRLGDGAEAGPCQMVLFDVEREAVRLPGQEADQGDNRHRDHLKPQAQPRRKADVANREEIDQHRYAQIQNPGWNDGRYAHGGDQRLHEERGCGGQRHGGEDVGGEHRPAGQHAGRRIEAAGNVDEERAGGRDLAGQFADIIANDHQGDGRQHINQPGGRSSGRHDHRDRDGGRQSGRNIGD